jgi:tetraacyldisaccharide 4'-kinase
MNVKYSKLSYWIRCIICIIYGQLTALRNLLYDRGIFKSYDSPLPVISIGNIVVGGSGKSPVTFFLASEFLKLGKRPVVLSRGYGGKLKGPVQVGRDHLASDVGDEPLMLWEKGEGKIPVVICGDRLKGAKFITSKDLGNLIILDDGFQHRRLKRDLDIVLIDISSSSFERFCNEQRLLPAGRLREAIAPALNRADILLLVSRDGIIGSKIELPIPVFNVRLYLTGFRDLRTGKKVPPPKSAAIATAIARPEFFEKMLQAFNIQIRGTFFFPDHHFFSDSDLAHIYSDSEPSMPLVVTEKDAIKLRQLRSIERTVIIAELGCDSLVDIFKLKQLQQFAS